MNNTEIIELIAALGIGGIIGAWITSILEKRKEVQLKLNQINEEKYRSILVHMSCALDIENRKYFSINEEYKGKTKEYYLNCVKEYYFQSLLYTPDYIIKDLKLFLEDPNKTTFVRVAKSMRKDLWGKKTKLKIDELLLSDDGVNQEG
ncbi:hypothetical protein GF362_07040 [Candidatus Dojkabacteria bacterium]|nr:hypothetical protein [Candidatus Dojkabacteria bacterium]